MFGTSQAPVREALRELDNYGLVEVRPRRGTFVGSFLQRTLGESYVVRASLEETATRLVLLHDSVPIQLLADDIEGMTQAAKRGEVETVVTTAFSFHRHIVEASGNELLRRSWESLHVIGRTNGFITTSSSRLGEVTNQHVAILDGLKSGDVDAACREAREHQLQFIALTNASVRPANRPRRRGSPRRTTP